tara:strand:- start:285 stop:695 length:411 start_codon:yes stop_codon:yes gene_type:complete
MSDSPSPSDDIRLAVKILKAKKPDELRELKIKLEADDYEVTKVMENLEQYMYNDDEDGELANIVILLYNGGIEYNKIESFLISQINQLVKPIKRASPSKKAKSAKSKKASPSKKASGKRNRRTHKRNRRKHKKGKK